MAWKPGLVACRYLLEIDVDVFFLGVGIAAAAQEGGHFMCSLSSKLCTLAENVVGACVPTTHQPILEMERKSQSSV